MSVQLNERYSKLLADYYITRGLIMVSDNPKEMYEATLNLLNALIDEIDPAFFAEFEWYTQTRNQLFIELQNLEQNGAMFNGR